MGVCVGIMEDEIAHLKGSELESLVVSSKAPHSAGAGGQNWQINNITPSILETPFNHEWKTYLQFRPFQPLLPLASLLSHHLPDRRHRRIPTRLPQI